MARQFRIGDHRGIPRFRLQGKRDPIWNLESIGAPAE